MRPTDCRAWETAAWLALLLGTAAFAALVLPLGLHPDDVQIISVASKGGYAHAWTSPFLDRFYRPLTVTLVKASLDVFGQVAVPLRALQAALIAATVLALARVFRDRSAFARACGGLGLLAAPLTFVAVTPFAVGVADTIVGLSFLLCVWISSGERAARPRTPLILVGLSLIALLAKESGVLVAAFCILRCAPRRRWKTCAVLLALAAGYLAFRGSFVAHRAYSFQTGFGVHMYSVDELQAKFGDSPHLLYGYDVLANLSSALFYVPEKGRFHLTGLIAFLALACTLTTALIARYLIEVRDVEGRAALLAVIPLNACLGYMYVRPRIMFVAYVAVSVLFLHAVDDLWRRPQRVLGVPGRAIAAALALLWLGVLASSLVRLRLQAG